MAALLYLEPLVTQAGGVVLLDEGIGASTVGGGLLVFAGGGVGDERLAQLVLQWEDG